MATRTSAPSQGEVPQYKLTEKAYIDDRLLEVGEVIYYEHPPGAHMAPLNDAARAMVKKHPPREMRPLEELPVASANQEKEE